jgi:chromosomal replication initiator protein
MKGRISPYVFPGIKKGDLNLSFLKSKQFSISPMEILKVVAEHHFVSVEDVVRKNNKREASEARHVYCAVMKNEFRYTFKFIGDILNGRDHTTVIHSINTFKDRSKFEEGYKENYEKIVKQINSKIN